MANLQDKWKMPLLRRWREKARALCFAKVPPECQYFSRCLPPGLPLILAIGSMKQWGMIQSYIRVSGHLSQNSNSDVTPPRIRLGKAELMEEGTKLELDELCRAWMGTHGKLVLAEGGFMLQMVTRGHFSLRNKWWKQWLWLLSTKPAVSF